MLKAILTPVLLGLALALVIRVTSSPGPRTAPTSR